jgi:preprotein translocase subunit Sec61beta
MDHEEPLSGTTLTSTRLRTPRAAAVAGILFSLLIALVLVLILISTPSDPAAPGAWLSNSARRGTVALALNLVPFAGITFLWFIGVVRDRLGHLEDRFFASVFLGSGLLFVAMLFVGGAFSGGLLAEAVAKSAAAPGPDTLAVGRQITSLLLRLYAMRMAAVFTMSAATITLRTRVAPRWIGMLGIAIAVVLLVTVNLTLWVALLFPAWILLLSVDILRTGFRRSPGAARTATGTA